MDLIKISKIESEIEIKTCSSIKFFFLELPRKISLFLRVLVGFSLFYVHENILTCAIIYTFLDFLPIIVMMIILCSSKKKSYIKDRVTRWYGIKFLLDPSRFPFKANEEIYEPDKWNSIVLFNSVFTLWCSLLGIIFSSVFIASDFICNELCDQFIDRLDRFVSFFTFCLVINVLAFLYSLTTIIFAANDKFLFRPVFQDSFFYR